MPRTAARFTQADISRAIRAVQQTGNDMAVELRPDGVMRSGDTLSLREAPDRRSTKPHPF